MILSLGALLGFLSIAFGAYAEHGLKTKLSPEAFYSISKAVHYQQIHAAMIVAIGFTVILNTQYLSQRLLHLCGYGFIIGTCVFCGSIYIAALTQLHDAVNLAPLGGATLMISWLLLVWIGLYCQPRHIRNT
jgi:uncharacterized membrane protein YgdD (TMEM256/DUF423 family)